MTKKPEYLPQLVAEKIEGEAESLKSEHMNVARMRIERISSELGYKLSRKDAWEVLRWATSDREVPGEDPMSLADEFNVTRDAYYDSGEKLIDRLNYELVDATRTLVGRLQSLSNDCQWESKQIEEQGTWRTINGLGLIQGRGAEIDTLCAQIAELKRVRDIIRTRESS